GEKVGEKKKMKKNPRTGRKTVYLGHRVKDTGDPGLDSLREVRDISKAILEDCRKGRITKKQASGRFARLHNTVLPRDKDFKGEKLKKALEIVEEYWDML
ncbi:hypothetical protein, partial [Archaeoglobus sp.]